MPEDISQLESLESKVIWEYIGADPPLNSRRTLDQFGYPSLQDTYARDDDQMLYKLTKKHALRSVTKLPLQRADTFASRLSSVVGNEDDSSTEAETSSEEKDEHKLQDGNLLMVDQLWLWAIDTSMRSLLKLWRGTDY